MTFRSLVYKNRDMADYRNERYQKIYVHQLMTGILEIQKVIREFRTRNVSVKTNKNVVHFFRNDRDLHQYLN